MKKFIIIISILGIQSCKTTLLNLMIKDPKVENPSTITKFLTENNFSSKNVGLLKGDTDHVASNFAKGYGAGYLVFNRDGNHLCYNGLATCSGVQFRQLITNGNDSFSLCKTDGLNLASLLDEAVQLNGESFDLNTIPKTEYYVVIYWQKFMGGKKNYKDGIEWMEYLVKDSSRFTFFKINNDMQESWGLRPGGKAKLKMEKNDGRLSMTLEDIPYQ